MIDGKYTMRGVAGALGKANTGTPQIGIELAVTRGESEGERITYYGFFTPNASEYTFKTMRDLGWEGDDITNLAGLDKNEVTVYVGTDVHEGKQRQKVKAIYPLGGAGIANPLSDTEAKVLAAQMKGAAIASRSQSAAKPASKPKGTTSRQATTEAPPDDFDEDAPF